jgi:hypothetical protein
MIVTGPAEPPGTLERFCRSGDIADQQVKEREEATRFGRARFERCAGPLADRRCAGIVGDEPALQPRKRRRTEPRRLELLRRVLPPELRRREGRTVEELPAPEIRRDERDGLLVRGERRLPVAVVPDRIAPSRDGLGPPRRIRPRTSGSSWSRVSPMNVRSSSASSVLSTADRSIASTSRFG